MDVFKKTLDGCGVGGIKCHCCRPTNKGRKDRKWTRRARRVIKQKDSKESRALSGTELSL